MKRLYFALYPSVLLLFTVVGALLLLASCSSEQGEQAGAQREFLSIGTAPPGGAFFVVGGALAQVIGDNAGSLNLNWQVTTEATKGTQENIRRLDQGELDFALANAAITYFAVRGEGDWEKAYPMRSVMTLAPNVALFITPASSGIKAIADLKGRRVVVGPAGAGFEYFVEPLLRAHGVAYTDFTPLNNTQAAAVDMLADGSAAAAFLGGAIPTASITQACASQNIYFIPFDPQVRQQLVADYPFFEPATIPANTYRGQTEPYEGLNVGSMHLITAEQEDEEKVYQVTKLLYEFRQQVVEKHPAGRSINAENAVKDTGTPFHPGAIRYYREIGIWPEPPAGD